MLQYSDSSSRMKRRGCISIGVAVVIRVTVVGLVFY